MTTLHPWQREGAERVVAACRQVGGAVLADAVGLGKTRTALEAARQLGGHVRVVCPPALIGHWRAEAAALDMDVCCFSWGAFSQRRNDKLESVRRSMRVGVVIADEAHLLRNPGTVRAEQFVRFAHGARVILVSATPVVNRPADLACLCSFYLDKSAYIEACRAGSRRALGVVKRNWGAAAPGRQAARRTEDPWVGPNLPDAERWAQTCRSAMALDATHGALFESVVLRRWASSPEAAAKTWARLRLLLISWRDAGGRGRVSRRRAASALVSDEALRCFAQGLLGFEGVSKDDALDRALASVASCERDAHTLRYEDTPQADELARHIAQSPGPVLLFSQFRATACAVGDWLERRGACVVRVCGAGVWHRAAGCVTVEEGARWFSEGWADRFDAVVMTPVGAEGWNLQGATSVVHLDTPWNPAALEQREGRALRLGGAREVAVHAVVPHPSVEARLGALALLAKKEEACVWWGEHHLQGMVDSSCLFWWGCVRGEIDALNRLADALWRAGQEALAERLLVEVMPRVARYPSRLSRARWPPLWQPGVCALSSARSWLHWAEPSVGAQAGA